MIRKICLKSEVYTLRNKKVGVKIIFFDGNSKFKGR
jgi:hypothetical protein